VVATKYGYDLADRLISVDISPLSGTVQPRRFSYDGRGFLKSETHPELDSEITYSYDARGHAVSKSLTTASDFDLRFVYDGAERLTSVSSRGGESFRVAKSFDFATTGVNNGRLLSANRYNYLPGSSEYYLVKEGYGYDAHGRVSSRTTNIKRVNGGTETLVREFTQSRTYNDLDLPETIVYPQCVGCGSANRTVTPGYTRGLLTSIPGFITDIDYAASGMTTAVLHANNITDVVTASANGLGRPAAVAFQGFCTAPQVTTNPADQDVERGSTVMLISGASGSSPQYQWSKRLASSAVWSNIPGANGATLSISVGAETYFHLTAVNGCGTAVSRDVRVTVFDRPTISVPPSSQTINGGNSAQLSVTASGTAPLTYRWYRGSSGDTGQPIAAPAGTQATYAPVLWATTSYWVRVMDGFGRTVDSTTATVTVVLPAPNGLTATSMTNGSISVTWNASSGAAQYRVERRSGSGFVSVAIVQSPAVTYVHSNSPSNKAYVYRVVAEDPDGGSDSAPSNQDLVTSTVFTTVQVNSVVSIGPFNEILVAINAVRSAASSSATPLTWANLVSAPLPAGGTIAEVSAITALRTQLNLARGSLGFPNLSFTDSAPTLIKAVHLNQLQDGLR
jgi:YD repeat-containing protein